MNAKITPVKKTAAPKYPDQYAVELDKLLLAHKPLRWSAVSVAGTVLSAVVMMGLAGCSDFGTVTMGDPVPQPYYTEPSSSDDDLFTLGEVAPVRTPLFEHGEGIGMYGCLMVNAPVFVSEDDAFAIIRDEFAKENMKVERGGGQAENIPIPEMHANYDAQINVRPGALEFDFAVRDRNIVMEYVSSDDIKAWIVPDEEGQVGWSSVAAEPYKEAARVLNDGLNDQYYGGVHGVFYDPGEAYEHGDDESEQKAAQERSADALRAQVKDFIEWLAAQGVI